MHFQRKRGGKREEKGQKTKKNAAEAGGRQEGPRRGRGIGDRKIIHTKRYAREGRKRTKEGRKKTGRRRARREKLA
jgi:hypothetical protein